MNKQSIEKRLVIVQKELNDLRNLLEETEIKTFKRGDRFLISGVQYIIAQTNFDSACLISLEDGNRYNNPEPIESGLSITVFELEKLGAYASQKI